jgi:thioredoxin reductase
MSEPRHHKVIIIGASPAGLTAAICAASHLQPFCVRGSTPAGSFLVASSVHGDVENCPGFPEKVSVKSSWCAFANRQSGRGP